MKRIILFLAIALMGGTIMAQTSTQINFRTLERKIDRSNADIEHPKKSVNHQTWLTRGELMMEVYDAMILSASPGMSINEFTIIVGTPKEKNQTEEEGNVITEVIMDRVTFYFVNDILESWKFTNNLVEEPLNVAYNSFLKAQELDTRARATSKLNRNLNRLKYLFISEGSNCYTIKDYTCSFKNFATAVEIGEMSIVNHVDTVVVYYAGLSAQVGGNFEKAIEYYIKSLDYSFFSEGNIYYNIYEAYVNLKRDEEGVKYLETGFLKFPNNQGVLYGLINHYITKGEDPKIVLDYIHKAMESEPDDFSLFFAEGTLYDKLESFEDAERSYKRSIELNPNFYDALFNLGALYFNRGVKYLEEANKVPAREMDKYDALILKSNEEFKKSIPYMEKAYKVSAQPAVVETLRNLYFRFRNEGAEMMKKYEEINEIWEGMKE